MFLYWLLVHASASLPVLLSLGLMILMPICGQLELFALMANFPSAVL